MAEAFTETCADFLATDGQQTPIATIPTGQNQLPIVSTVAYAQQAPTAFIPAVAVTPPPIASPTSQQLATPNWHSGWSDRTADRMR